ncbi:Hpt domain-containing protein [Nocardioides sp. zg-DK7169]|uniref:Hpt domain-containing protein n=1 Tax=Nocardioides sp. zg-DK7169 TaxID=2736600 RepID=UPI0020A6C564|nr:Hpt domain-containing protein [Nocardioides sp. zg-DK7169]
MDGLALDVSVLEGLAEDLADRAFVASLAERFEALLDPRLARIASALETGDAEAAMDSTLSLKASAATIGARELLDLAVRVEDAVRAHDPARALAELPRLYAATRGFRSALADYLGRERD